MVSSGFSGRRASLLWLRFSQNALGNRKLYFVAGAGVYFSLIQPGGVLLFKDGHWLWSKTGTGLDLTVPLVIWTCHVNSMATQWPLVSFSIKWGYKCLLLFL